MRLKSVKIENYKSFGEQNNILVLENLNTIIGKNESGKSNLIECLSKIDLTGINDNNFFNKYNRNTGHYPEIGIVLTPYDKEKGKYSKISETILTLNDKYDIDISGGLSDVIVNDEIFQKNRDRINELKSKIGYNIFDQTQQSNFNSIISMINNAESKMFINYGYIKTIIDKISKYDEYEEFLISFKECISFLNDLKILLPRFIEVKDISLKSKYTKKYLDDDKESKIMLKHLLNCINMGYEELMEYWELTSQADKMNFIEDFNIKLNDIIKKFNKFYSQESVEMKAAFENDSLNFVVRTTKKYMEFEERSNGLKWYLNMFFQIISKTNNYEIENYIILIDEPGVYLHVNAQKELLALFEDFITKNNQIIYTTHSPFMIYDDKLYQTKLIIKDDNGNSNIGNKYYSLPHKMGSKSETITPLLTAIGMNMNYNILTLNSEKVNIITEGISDFNYIKGYYLLKKETNIPNIIPSTSVDNIHNIASIFIGWGCSFKIVLDQDNSGRGEYKVLAKKLLIDLKNIIFIDGTNKPNTKAVVTIEDLFSENDKNIIGINNEDYNSEKAYYSLETLKKIENNELSYDKETMNNFERMLSKLFDEEENDE